MVETDDIEAEKVYSRVFPQTPKTRTVKIVVLVRDEGRITIPKTMRYYLGLGKGDLARLVISKANGDT